MAYPEDRTAVVRQVRHQAGHRSDRAFAATNHEQRAAANDDVSDRSPHAVQVVNQSREEHLDA